MSRIRSFIAVAIALAAGALLVSCDAETKIVVYVNDVLDIIAGKETTLQTTATVNVEISSENEKDKVLSMLQPYFMDIGNVKTFDRNMNTYLSFEAHIPLVRQGSGKNPAEGFLSVLVTPGRSGGNDLSIAIDKEDFKALNDSLAEDFYGTISVSDISFSLTLNNDSRNDCRVRTAAVYLDGEPAPLQTETIVARRQELEIRLSDVLRDTLEVNDSVVAVTTLE